MSNFVLIFILACAGHGSHAQTLVETGHGPEIPECQSADNSAGTSKDWVKLLQRRVEVGKDVEDELPVDEYMADKHLKDVLPEDRHMEDDTSESGGDNIMNMAQLQEDESHADEEEDDLDENDLHADDFLEDVANHKAQLIANEQDSTHGLALPVEDPVREPPAMEQLSPEMRYGQCFGMAGGEERCQFAAGGECEDIPYGALDAAGGLAHRWLGGRDHVGAGYANFPEAWAACNRRIMRPRMGSNAPLERSDPLQSCWNHQTLGPRCSFSAGEDQRCPLGAGQHVGVNYPAEWSEDKKQRFRHCGVQTTWTSEGYDAENSTYRFVNRRDGSRFYGSQHPMYVHIQATSIGSILHDVCCGHFKSRHGPNPLDWPEEDGIGCQGPGKLGFNEGLRLGGGAVTGIRSLPEIYAGVTTWHSSAWSKDDSVASMMKWADESPWFHKVCGPEWFMASLHGNYGAQHPVAPTWSSCEDTNLASPAAWASKLKFSPVCGGGRFGEEFSMERVVRDALLQWSHVGPPGNRRDQRRQFLQVSLTGQLSNNAAVREEGEILLAIYKQVFDGMNVPWDLLAEGPSARHIREAGVPRMTATQERRLRALREEGQAAVREREEEERRRRAQESRRGTKRQREEEAGRRWPRRNVDEVRRGTKRQRKAEEGRRWQRRNVDEVRRGTERQREEEAGRRWQRRNVDEVRRGTERQRKAEEGRRWKRRNVDEVERLRRVPDGKDSNVTLRPSRSTSDLLANCNAERWNMLDTRQVNFKDGSAKRWRNLSPEDKACFCSKMKVKPSPRVVVSSQRACVVYPNQQATTKLAHGFHALSTGKGFYCHWQDHECVPKPDEKTVCEDRTHEFMEKAGSTTCSAYYPGYACISEESFKNCPKYCEICQ